MITCWTCWLKSTDLWWKEARHQLADQGIFKFQLPSIHCVPSCICEILEDRTTTWTIIWNILCSFKSVAISYILYIFIAICKRQCMQWWCQRTKNVKVGTVNSKSLWVEEKQIIHSSKEWATANCSRMSSITSRNKLVTSFVNCLFFC